MPDIYECRKCSKTLPAFEYAEGSPHACGGRAKGIYLSAPVEMTLAERIRYNLQCFESDPPNNNFSRGMKQMLEDLMPYAQRDS